MDISNNLQSTSFGMAYKTADIQKLRKYGDSLGKDAANRFAEGVKYAVEKLGTATESKTKKVDLHVYVKPRGRVEHMICIPEYIVDSTSGAISTRQRTLLRGSQEIPNIVNETLMYDAEAIKAYERALAESNAIKKAHKNVGSALDLLE